MSEATMPGAQGEAALHEDDVLYRKVFCRLVPILFGCYIIAYLDRVNVGFAKLQMLADLHLSEAVYGTGAGIFFLGYFLFEVPSNLILRRRAPLDRAYHDHLGHRLGSNDVCDV